MNNKKTISLHIGLILFHIYAYLNIYIPYYNKQTKEESKQTENLIIQLARTPNL